LHREHAIGLRAALPLVLPAVVIGILLRADPARAQVRNAGEAMGNAPGAFITNLEMAGSWDAVGEFNRRVEREGGRLPPGTCRSYEAFATVGGTGLPLRIALRPAPEQPGPAFASPRTSTIPIDSPRGREIVDNPPVRGEALICSPIPPGPGAGFGSEARAILGDLRPREYEARLPSGRTPAPSAPAFLRSHSPGMLPAAGPYDASRYPTGIDYGSLTRGVNDLSRRFPFLGAQPPSPTGMPNR
jgi:hypothetical protein